MTQSPEFNLGGIGWVIIGSMTGPKRTPTSGKAVANLFVEASRLSIPIFIKDNCNWPNSIGKRPQRFPEGFP